MKNRVLKFLTLGAALCGLNAWAEEYSAATQSEFVTVAEKSVSGDTIILGTGDFAIGPVDINGKTLTFKGQGATSTKVYIGNGGYDGNGGHGSSKTANMTFIDLTLDDLASDSGYLTGFTEAGKLTFENVTFNCGFSNWGNKNKDVTFTRCTFNQTVAGKYCVQELRCNSTTENPITVLFDTCTFNHAVESRFINAYKQNGAAATLNIVVKDCTFNNNGEKSSYAAVNCKDDYSNGCNINLTFVGENKANGPMPDSDTTSALYATQSKGHVIVSYKDALDSDSVVIFQNSANTEDWFDPNGYKPQSGDVEPPAEEITYTRVDNFFENETPPTAYVTELPEADVAAENMECGYSFKAWSDDDYAIFRKCVWDSETMSFDVSALTAAEKARFDEFVEAIEPYAGCHADFVVKFDRPVKADSVMLKGNYGTYGWLGFAMTRDMAANEELRLLNDGIEGLQIRFSYAMILTDVVEFLCGAANLSAANFGTTMTVELRLYEPVTDGGMDEIGNYDKETGRYMVIGTYSHTFKKPMYREVRLSTTDSVLKDADDAAIAAPSAAQSGILANVQGAVGANTPSEDMTGTGVIPAAQAAVTDAGDAAISGYVKIRLDAVQVTTKADSTAALKSIAYDVQPMAIITRVDGDGQTTVEEQEIPNEKITAPITFRLPVTADFVKGARIKHTDDADRFAQVEVEGGKRFVTVSADHFSIFTLYPDEVAEAAVGSSNIMAIKRVPGGSARAEVVAPVPWKRLDDVAQDMTVDRLVATGRANGDEIAVWNEARRDYDVWRWSETLGWEVGQSTVSGVTAPAAATTTLKQGTAVWFKRGTPAAAYSEIGGYTPGLVTSKPEAVAGKAANTLMINPYFEAVDLAKIENAGTGDQIQIISTKKVYVWKGQWGWLKLVQKTTPFGATVTREEFVPEASIPLAAGEGFWYISRGGTPTVDWKAIKAN